MFEEAGCEVRIAALPAGSDPDTVIQEEGASRFQQLLNEAPPLVEYRLEMLARRHDLRTPEGRLALVREAARVVGELRSTVAREHHRGLFAQRLRRLAELWHPGDAARAQEAERALRMELQQAWQSAARPARAEEFDGEGRSPQPLAQPPSGDSKAEALLLRAALTEARWAERIGATLGADGFQEPRHRGVAAALFGDTGDWSDRLRAVWADPELTEAASALVIVDGEPPPDDAQVDGALSRLVTRRKRRRKQELQQELQPEILQGRIEKNDPRYQEYLQLVSDLGGQGLKGEG
jgi:DNA primase